MSNLIRRPDSFFPNSLLAVDPFDVMGDPFLGFGSFRAWVDQEFARMESMSRRRSYSIQTTDDEVKIKVYVGETEAEKVELLDDEGRLQLLLEGDHFASFQIPEDVERERISAEVADGYLQISLPRQARPEPRRIAVMSTKTVDAPMADKSEKSEAV